MCFKNLLAFNFLINSWKWEAWKNQGFNGIRTRDLRVTGAMLYQLSYEATRWEVTGLGAHHQEPATTLYSCHGVFTDRSIFSLHLSRVQIPTGISETNCNNKHGLMSKCGDDVDMFTWGRIVSSSQKRAHVDWNCLFRGKISKIEDITRWREDIEDITR